MRLNLLAIFVSIILFAFSTSIYAGNSGNSSDTGNVTAIVVCEADESEEEGGIVPISVEYSSMAVLSDACACELPGAKTEELGCSEEDSCALCLATLQRAGLNIYDVNNYVEPADEILEDAGVTVHNYNLKGNAGPFIVRLGGCPCEEE